MDNETTTTKEEYLRKLQMFVLFFLAFAAIAFTGFDAFANGMEAAVDIVYGQAGGVVQPLGYLAIMMVGIAGIFGRISITQGLIVCAGIAIAAHPDQVLSIVSVKSVSGAAVNAQDVVKDMLPALGVLGIVVVGISAMFGRLSVTQALVVAIAIVVATSPSEFYTLAAAR
jgi:type IV secretory pathway VirB2 component (pilin)